MDCWEALYMQVFRQQKILIDEQQVNNTNPLFELANIPYNSWREFYPVHCLVYKIQWIKVHDETVKLTKTLFVALCSPDTRAGRNRQPSVNERS